MIGPRIRELREERGLTREQLAGAAGVNPHTLRDVELELYPPGGWGFVCALADALGVRLDDLRRPAAPVARRGPGRPKKK